VGAEGWVQGLGSEVTIKLCCPNSNMDGRNGAESVGGDCDNWTQARHPCPVGQAWNWEHVLSSRKKLSNMVMVIHLCSFWFGHARL